MNNISRKGMTKLFDTSKLISKKKVVGIGLGPSNLSLAIALYEDQNVFSEDEWIFLERQNSISWHPGMLLPGTKLQVPFTKDLVTLRNPTSYFSFLNYLKKRERLDEFINNGQNSPSRLEYTDYLKWVKDSLPSQCIKMGATVINIEPFYEDGETTSTSFLITYEKGGERNFILAEQLIVGVGGTPQIPHNFKDLDTNHVWHSSSFKNKLNIIQSKGKCKIGVIGSGQSAAEIIDYLHENISNSSIYSIMRRPSFRPEDDSPFVNEVFFPKHVDFMYSLNQEKREKVLDDYWHANYSAVNIDLINLLYEKMYTDKVKNIERVKILNYTQVTSSKQKEKTIDLKLQHMLTDDIVNINIDFLILATGYDRLSLPNFLKAFEENIDYKSGKLDIDREYRLKTKKNVLAPLYIQGMSESVHGITNTLLSILPLRAGEIVEALLKNQGLDSSFNKQKETVLS
jgi:L-ornithine N5-monooxygenase